MENIAEMLGHADRGGPLKDYRTGPPCERKSVEPIASILSPTRASAAHLLLLHFVGQSNWPDKAVLSKVRELAAPAFVAQGGVEAWIIDDAGFQKKGFHSVGVVRQYCGRPGKTENCQIAVTLSIANHHSSLATRPLDTDTVDDVIKDVCARNAAFSAAGSTPWRISRKPVYEGAYGSANPNASFRRVR